MAQISRSLHLLRKAEAALISAIEIYNKPNFAYREETFSILALNAWELLLKAKRLADRGNKPQSIYVYERRRTKNGQWSKKLYLKRNRAGNIHTMGFGQILAELDKGSSTRLPSNVRANLDALTEIRDNAVHFVNAIPELEKIILEVGTASIKNFIELSQRWFNHDLSQYSLYLMPIGFVAAPGSAIAVKVSPDEEKVVRYLRELIATTDETDPSGLHVALEVNLSFKRSEADAVASFSLTRDPKAPKILMSEEDIRKTFPWDYKELTGRLQKRYSDFKVNRKYHEIRKRFISDDRFTRRRYLDPGNPRSQKKDYYNPNILKEFDPFYTKVAIS